MTIHAVTLHDVRRRSWAAGGQVSLALAALTVGLCASEARAQATPAPTSPTLTCPDPNPPFVMPPEIASSGGILRGTINLSEQFIRLPSSVGGVATCAPQLVRTFQGAGLPPSPSVQPPAAGYADPMPGPTLRARVGELVQLTLVNQVNSNRFDRNIDLEECTRVGQNGSTYPATIDTFPNCLHASSTANIHFHGTHTSPSSTGDNVYLQIRPLPRDNQGNLTTTPAQATASLDDFFGICAQQLRNPLNQWPVHWNDVPRPYIDKQIEMLTAYEQQNPTQPLWTLDQQVLAAGQWPQYYVGAYPYCFALPAYTANVWPPPPGSTSPNMGQSPGTHWYHAHKHGSTAINVGNGMTGVFIIEGQYDTDLNTFYSRYTLKDGQRWNIKTQPVMVLNQLLTVPNRISGSGPTGLDFVVNGRLQPVIQMQPGEVQLWRIANTAGRSAAYFMAPQGIEWRQIAQDGVQFADENYQNSQNVPFYLAPGNRVDLLVKAPMRELNTEVRIQNVMGRAKVAPTPVNPNSNDPVPGLPLLKVSVSGPPVRLGTLPAEMPFINRAPTQPPFLVDIADWELKKGNYATKTLDFNSKPRNSAVQHTINGLQFEDGQALVSVTLGAAEEWTIKNSTGANPGIIDHPFHIHINPFQITEFFDPNENLVDPKTGQLEGVVVNGKTVPIPKYVVSPAVPTDPRQCLLKPDDPRTWSDCHPTKGSYLVWWDVFAIPSGRAVKKTDGTSVVIPGFFKMRSRFVDYQGLYVLHCHILIHEDRGMMFSVEVSKPRPILVKHH
jgi:FtsP/CotA-like multicopper oxidase with cupredoxin domain